MALKKSNTIYPDDVQGIIAEIDALPPGKTVNNIDYFQVEGKYYRRVVNGIKRAVECGIKTDGSNQASHLQTLLDSEGVNFLLDIPGDVIISSSVDGRGKTLHFENGAKITGGGTLSNLTIEAANNQQIFDTTVTASGLQKASMAWWGAKRTYANDLIAVKSLQAAINACAPGGTVVIPADAILGGSYYYMSGTTININKDIKLIGEGMTHSPRSTLIWAPNTICFNITNGARVEMENLHILQEIPIGPATWDTSKHAIQSTTFVYLKNCSIEQIAGDGLHIDAQTGSGSADQSSVKNCYFTNCNNGVYLTGGDANIISFVNNDYTANRHWGYYSNGFLGNRHYNEHFADNGKANDVLVNYAGVTYAAINTIEGSANLSRRPDISSSYWRVMPFTFPSYPAWSGSTNYFSGGTYCVTDPNALEAFYSPYSERYQPYPIISPRTLVVNPFDEQGGATDGASLAAIENELTTGASLYAKKFIHTDGDVTSHTGSFYAPHAGTGIWFNAAQEGIVSAGSPTSEGKHLKIFSGSDERAYFDLSHYFTLWASPIPSDSSKKVATTEWVNNLLPKETLLTTASATPTTIATITTQANTSLEVYALFLGHDSSNNEISRFAYSYLVKNIGGTLTIVNTAAVYGGASGSFGGSIATPTVSGTSLLLRVQGNTNNIYWKVNYTTTTLTPIL